MLIPTVIEKSQFGERAYDIYSRLLRERIVFAEIALCRKTRATQPETQYRREVIQRTAAE